MSNVCNNIDSELIGEFNDDIINIIKLKSDNNWADIRSVDGNFIPSEREYPFGKRIVFEPIEDIKNLNLQRSRGIGIPDDCTIEDIVNNVNHSMTIGESDQVRINEIEKVYHLLDASVCDMFKLKFCEIGFRIPRLMRYYFENHDMQPFGFEYNPLNVNIAKKMGYDAIHMNLMDPDDSIKRLKEASLVVCYHVLEHVSRPQEVLKNIFTHMSIGSYLHIEVPIEPGIPRLQFGHLFPFDHHDLKYMGESVGFKLITCSRETHTGGPVVERYMMLKDHE